MTVYASTCTETGAAAETLLCGHKRTIYDPVNGTSILYRNLGQVPTSAYASADAAYNAWATARGVDSTRTDVAGIDGNVDDSGTWFNMGFPCVDGYANTWLMISHGGGIHLRGKATSSTTRAVVASRTYTSSTAVDLSTGGGIYFPKESVPTDTKPHLTLNGCAGSVALARWIPAGMKIVKVPGVDEVICIFSQLYGLTAPNYEVRTAIRLRPAYCEMVVTNVDTANIIVFDAYDPTSAASRAELFTSKEDGYVLYRTGWRIVDNIGGTVQITSDDLGYLRGNVSEGVGIAHPVVAPKWTAGPTLTQGILAFNQQLQAGWTKTLADTVNTIEGSAPAVVKRFGPTIAEIVGQHDATILTTKYAPVLADTARILDAIYRGTTGSISEGIGVNDAIIALRAVIVAERLGMAPTLLGPTKYYRTLADLVALSEVLKNFLSGVVVESLGLHDAPLRQFRPAPTVTDTVTITDPYVPHWVVRALVTDSVNIDDLDLEHLLYGLSLHDTIQLSAAFIQPSGTKPTITTWAINTRTGAATEYRNYEFNSFAQSGNKYLAAARDGIYELNGSTDAGTNIVARIKSGFAQFSGGHFSAFKGVYLGVRGPGNYVLKLTTGDGKTYTYNAVAGNMQTTKVEVGKGLRARYWSFELISTGQDFDLDTIEFIPLTASRRV